MRVPVPVFRRLILVCGLYLALFSEPSYALSDNEARYAILELREQLRQITEQSNRAHLQLSKQLQALQQEVIELRNQLELATVQQPGLGTKLKNP